jgi:histidine triad (HIT) family protein
MRAVQDCIFCKIVRGEIPSKKVYEDDQVLAFHDIRPQAPVHFMLVPKRHIASLAEATPADADVLGRMMSLAGRLAREQGSPDGFRAIVNTGRVGRQDVMHVHIHIIGGPDPLGPMLPRSAG